jgi:hypothetical protein
MPTTESDSATTTAPDAPSRLSGPNPRDAELREDLALVIAEWDAISRDEPWHVHPEHYGLDSLHETIRGVLGVALGDGAYEDASERLVRAAASHGDQRRLQGVTDDAVLREYHALRTALWRHLIKAPMPRSEALTAIMRVDVVITVATSAALRGFHRSDLTPNPEWATQLLSYIAKGSREIVDALGAKGEDHTTASRAEEGSAASSPLPL